MLTCVLIVKQIFLRLSTGRVWIKGVCRCLTRGGKPDVEKTMSM